MHVYEIFYRVLKSYFGTILYGPYTILILDQIETANYNIKTILGNDEQMTFPYDKYKLISK